MQGKKMNCRNRARHMMYRRLFSVLLLGAMLFLSCRGGGGGKGSGDGNGGTGDVPGNNDPGAGRVAMFLTDNISYYKQVIATITGVRLVNSGAQSACDVLTVPVTVDISNLTNIAHFVDAVVCPANAYNRIDIRFRKDVQLMDQLDTPSACSFASYLEDGEQPQALSCDPSTGICTLSIRGAVRQGSIEVLNDRTNNVGLDFDLKQFTVSGFGDPAACAVTMKVSPVDAASLNSSGRAHGVTGSISQVDPVAKTFLLSRGAATFTVDYSAVLPSLQPDLDALLQTAAAEGFRVTLSAAAVDLGARTIAASAVFALVEGTVSHLKRQPDWSFDLSFPTAKTLPVSHKPPAVIDGALLDGAWVSVRLEGIKKNEYRAARVEVLPPGMILDE